MTASVDVVVPTYNNLSSLLECVDAITGQKNVVARILVCVDGSTDGTKAALLERGGIAIVLLEHADGANHGRAAARNLALRSLRAPFVALVDSDMRLDQDALAKHVQLVQARGVVSIGAVLYERSSSLWARYQATRGRQRHRHGTRPRPLDFTSANTVLRSRDLIAVGGFDESLARYGGEDTELGLRLADTLGLEFAYNADAVARTTEGKSVAEGLAQLDQYSRTNLRTIRHRHPTGPAPFWIDRLESSRWSDRLFRLALNPVGETLARALLPWVPFAVQRRLLNYLVIRTVFRGYVEGPR